MMERVDALTVSVGVTAGLNTASDDHLRTLLQVFLGKFSSSVKGDTRNEIRGLSLIVLRAPAAPSVHRERITRDRHLTLTR